MLDQVLLVLDTQDGLGSKRLLLVAFGFLQL
jgi:hypothetical protein